MFCSKCGAEVKESDKFCANCGSPISSNEYSNYYTNGPAYGSSQYNFASGQNNGYNTGTNDPGSVGLAILSFFIPIVGFILWICMRHERPKTSKQCGIATLISIIFNVVVYGALIACIIASGGNVYY